MRNRGSRQNLGGAGFAPKQRLRRRCRSRHVHRNGPTASTGAFQATLMRAQELGQPVMDRLAFIAIMGGRTTATGGTGTSVTLTHFRARYRGQCTTFFAKVSGSFSF
jgi:hypothetical protein